MAADRQYVGQARVGMNFVVRQAATLNLVDGMYRREGIGTFQIVAVIADPLDQFFGSNVATNLLNGIVPAFANANLNISVAATRVARNVSAAFLTSGKPPDRSVPGQVTIGLANQPGITGMAFQDLSLGVGVELGSGAIAGGPNEWQNFMVMAHELGHIYNADHDEAEEFCRNFWIICWNKGRTVMWPMFTFRTTPYFSRGSNDAMHNNWRRILDNLMMRSP